jgi:uncharacterized protein (TIGR00290 family)
MPKPRAAISWSSGKDSAYALHEVRQAAKFEIVTALTTVTSAFGRVSMHGVREALLDQQMAALGLPCRKVPIPSPCSNETYERQMGEAVNELIDEGIEHIIFGDLFLADIREYREANLAKVGLKAEFPLWGRDTRSLAHDIVDVGIEATVVCIDPKKVARSLAGRPYDERFLQALPEGVDACGEHGEFHTVVTAAPFFEAPIRTQVGEIVERDGFVYADVALEGPFAKTRAWRNH